MTNEIILQDTGVVYKNPRSIPDKVVAQHPSLVPLDDGEFLATFDLDRVTRPFDYRTVVARSMDQGWTWSIEDALLLHPPPSTTHSIRASRLANGSLVGLSLLNRIDGPKAGVVNRETFGRIPGDLFLVRSADGGRSWTGPYYIQPPLVGPSWEICHPILELADGRSLAPTATWRGWNGENPSGEQSPVLISDDGGKTWPKFGRAFDGRSTGLTHWEQSVVQVQDGRLLAVAWVYDTRSGATHPTVYSISTDRGETFSQPVPTGFHAQTCKLLQLRDGRIVCTYRRHDAPGLWATVARLEGAEWTNVGLAPLWQGAESGMGGAGRGADELSELKFCYPSLRQLPGGEVLLLFWCEEEGFTDIRWLRFSPNPPKDTDGRREDSGRGWVRELQGRWPGVLG